MGALGGIDAGALQQGTQVLTDQTNAPGKIAHSVASLSDLTNCYQFWVCGRIRVARRSAFTVAFIGSGTVANLHR